MTKMWVSEVKHAKARSFGFLNFSFADLNLEPSTGNYFPTIFFNEFWLLRDKMIAINETVKELALNLEVGPISMTKWQLFLQIDQSFQIHRSYGSMLEGEADELKVLLIFVTVGDWLAFAFNKFNSQFSCYTFYSADFQLKFGKLD